MTVQELEEKIAQLEAAQTMWRDRADAALRGDGTHAGYLIPAAMLGELRRAQVVAWIALSGWAKTGEWARSGSDVAEIWRAVPKDHRGVGIWNTEDRRRLADAVRTMAHHCKLSQWDVLDQMLAL